MDLKGVRAGHYIRSPSGSAGRFPAELTGPDILRIISTHRQASASTPRPSDRRNSSRTRQDQELMSRRSNSR